MEGNQINSWVQISHLASQRQFPKLSNVSFKSLDQFLTNPICETENYDTKIRETFMDSRNDNNSYSNNENNNAQLLSIDHHRINNGNFETNMTQYLKEWKDQDTLKEKELSEQFNNDRHWVELNDVTNSNDNHKNFETTFKFHIASVESTNSLSQRQINECDSYIRSLNL